MQTGQKAVVWPYLFVRQEISKNRHGSSIRIECMNIAIFPAEADNLIIKISGVSKENVDEVIDYTNKHFGKYAEFISGKSFIHNNGMIITIDEMIQILEINIKPFEQMDKVLNTLKLEFTILLLLDL